MSALITAALIAALGDLGALAVAIRYFNQRFSTAFGRTAALIAARLQSERVR